MYVFERTDEELKLAVRNKHGKQKGKKKTGGGTRKVSSEWSDNGFLLVHEFIFMEGGEALLSDDKHFPQLLKNDTNVAGKVDAVIILTAEGWGEIPVHLVSWKSKY